MSNGLCLGGITQQGTMISNLPLLFADGYPTCLEKITVKMVSCNLNGCKCLLCYLLVEHKKWAVGGIWDISNLPLVHKTLVCLMAEVKFLPEFHPENQGQLEKFVPFMAQCSCGHDTSLKLTIPKWWPEDVEFSIPLVKPPGVESKWLAILKSLVCRCYTYHGCEFMLRFCTDLSQCPISELTFVDSWDGTTSLYNKLSGKLLVTFRNENMSYDRKKESPRKTLLPRDSDSSRSQIMVQPPLFDIYLCDGCDGEFITLKDVQDHEKECCRQRRDPSPAVPLQLLNTEQEKFLNYFHLSIATPLQSNSTALKNDSPRYKRAIGNSMRYTGIALSSPLGLLVHKKLRSSHLVPGVQLERTERYCSKLTDTSVRTRESRNSDVWPVSWKPRKKKEDEEDWVHLYTFPKRQWRRRVPSMQRDLSARSRRLLRLCRNVKIKVKKLSKQEIEKYTHRTKTGAQMYASSSLAEDEVVDHVFMEDAGDFDYPYNSLVTGNLVDPLCVDRATKLCQPFSIDTPLVPNTLYVYDKCEGSLQSRRASDREVNTIPVIDLCSSDEESDIVNTDHGAGSSNGVRSGNSQPSVGVRKRSFLSNGSTSRAVGVGSASTNACNNTVFSKHNGGYRNGLPRLVDLFTPQIVDYYTDSVADHCAYMNSVNPKSSSIPNQESGHEKRKSVAVRPDCLRISSDKSSLPSRNYELSSHTVFPEEYGPVEAAVACSVSVDRETYPPAPTDWPQDSVNLECSTGIEKLPKLHKHKRRL